MIVSRNKHRQIPAARRAQIIQRVLVDGWSPARAAEAFELKERWVADWVAAYRRRGMASLRDREGAPERAYRALWRHWQAAVARFVGPPVPREAAETADCIVLRRTGRDRFGQP